MPRSTRYSSEVGERAVGMLVEHRAEYPSEWVMTGPLVVSEGRLTVKMSG
jgi:hypothetical protein